MSGKVAFMSIIAAAVLMLGAGEALAGIPKTGRGEKLLSADALWRSSESGEARSVYEEVADDSGSLVVDRVGALQRLALQTWLYTGDSDSALALLRRAEELGEAKAPTYSMMSRVLLEEGLLDSALDVSRLALVECRTWSDSLEAVLSYGRAAFERGKAAYLAGKPRDLPALREAAQRLNAVGHVVPSYTPVWELSLGLSLLLDDGPSALQAWRQYFEMGEDDSTPASVAGLAQALTEVLPSWNGNELGQESRRALVKALAASRLYDYARLMATPPGLPYGDELRREPEIAGILGYADLVEEARARIAEIYRKRLTADPTIASDVQGFIGMAYNYWQTLDYPGERPEFTTDELGAQLGKRWGAAFCSVNFEPATFEMTWGHAMYEEVRQVEQRGHRAEVRLIILDQMVSNGMMEWFTDGEVEIAGWAPTPPIVYQIRPAFLPNPINAWERVASPEREERVQDRINRLRAVDDSLATANPYAHLPGVSLRVQHAGLTRLRDSLASSGCAGGELRRTFMREYARLRQESSIFAHEGQHIIDMAFRPDEFGKWDAATVELSAKLSEVLFSPDPWFSVGNSAAVFYATADSDTTSAHGSACYLVRKHLVGWMNRHASEIAGFDAARPTLPQLDLLSTEQLRDALRELYPLAESAAE